MRPCSPFLDSNCSILFFKKSALFNSFWRISAGLSIFSNFVQVVHT
jgi:hypothetical protein